jgi:hypothetical protein
MTHRQPTSATAHVLACLLVAWATACSSGDDQGSQPAAPSTTAPPITAAPGTALHHAQVCQQQLGRIPTWACQDGVQIPIQVGGNAVTTDQKTCDNADLKGKCAVGSYIGHLDGQNLDGSPKPDVNWVFFCRRDDNFAQMIGHDKSTGASCFFELNEGYMPLEQGVPKGTVPGMEAPGYEDAWKRPEAIVKEGCNRCHTPDPFIHTPFIDAARRPDDPGRPMVPEIASPTSLYYMPDEAFASWTFDHVEFDNNACTSCHRMPDFLRFTQWSHADYNAHMPPLAPGSMKQDFDAVMTCLTQGPDQTPGCHWAALNGATPTGNSGATKGAKSTDGQGTFVTTFGSLDAADPFVAGSGAFSWTELSFSRVGAIAGAAAGQSGVVQLDVIGHQEVAGLDFIAHFLVPVASFSSGKTIMTGDVGWSGQLLASGPDRSMAAVVGQMTKGTLTLTRAGDQTGDAVEGSFSATWQDDGKK